MKVVTLYFPGDGTKGSNSATYKNATIVNAGPRGITFTTAEDGQVDFAGPYRIKDKERAQKEAAPAAGGRAVARDRWAE